MRTRLPVQFARPVIVRGQVSFRVRLQFALLAAVLLSSGCEPAPTAPTPLEQAALDRAMRRLQAAQAAALPEAAEPYARDIIERFPASAEAAALRAQWPALQAAAQDARHQRQRAERWHYNAAEHPRGLELLAELEGDAADGAPPLRLVLRRHPRWGQSAYLLIDRNADFDCGHRCTLPMAFDEASATPVAVTRALDNVPPALFLRDHQAFYAALEAADVLQVEVPLRSGERVAYRFDVGGYQPARMQDDG